MVPHDVMEIITKVMFMYTIYNIVPRKEGREKVAIQDYLLVNKTLDGEKASLPKIIMKHIEHATSVQKHGIPYGLRGPHQEDLGVL